MNFDIDAIEASAAATFDVVVGQRDDGTPVGFRVIGAGSEQYSKAKRETELLAIKAAAANKVMIDMTTDEGAAKIADGSEKSRQIVLRHCIVDWFGFTVGGETAPFTLEMVSKVLNAKPGWATQILREIDNDSNFSVG